MLLSFKFIHCHDYPNISVFIQINIESELKKSRKLVQNLNGRKQYIKSLQYLYFKFLHKSVMEFNLESRSIKIWISFIFFQLQILRKKFPHWSILWYFPSLLASVVAMQVSSAIPNKDKWTSHPYDLILILEEGKVKKGARKPYRMGHKSDGTN